MFISEKNPYGDCDLLFRSKLYQFFENDNSSSDYLFIVHDKKYKCQYVILDCENVYFDSLFLHKVAAYVYYHPNYSEGLDIVYVIGDANQGKAIAPALNKHGIIKYVSREMIEDWYPKSLKEIESRIVNFLCDKQNYYGCVFHASELDLSLLFFCQSNRLSFSESEEQIRFTKDELIKKNIIEIVKGSEDLSGNFDFVLTGDGIEHFQTSPNNNNGKEAFIAIKFTDDKERVNAIKSAIRKAGYEPIIMNEVQTNNWIMPEIFAHIKAARFVVADFSIQCDGAYYEAGYAAALNKEVIHLFDKREEKNGTKLHFDISQKSTIIYSDFDELSSRLYNRIKATVGEFK